VASEIKREALKNALKALEPLADKRSPLIYKSLVEVSATGKTVNLRVSDGESEAGGSVKKSDSSKFYALVETKTLRKAVDAFSDSEIFLETDQNELILKNQSGKTIGLATNQSSSLPEKIKPGKKLASVEVSLADLSKALNRVIKIAQSADPTRPIISSVVFKNIYFLDKNYLNIVATDGKRLIEAPVEIQKESGAVFKNLFVWPLASIKALAAQLQRLSKEDIKIVINDFENIAEVKFLNMFWRSTGLAGNYPETDNLFQSARGENILGFDRDQMIESLKSVASISVGDAPVSLKLSGQVEVDYQVPGVTRFEETLSDSFYTGKAQEIAFNHQYLTELCQLISGEDFFDQLNSDDQIKARIPSDANAVLFYGDDFVRVLLMPIRK
jgi:DNA polymerase III sliding clamp (beta) subunit (PCNA family)